MRGLALGTLGVRGLALGALGAAALALACASPPLPAPPGSRAPDLAEDDVVTIVTRDADGDECATKVWIAEAEGDAWIIAGGSLVTGSSRWVRRLANQANVTLIAGGYAHPVRAEVVDDPAKLAAVRDAMRAKYGWQDRVAWITASREPILVRVRPR